MDDFTTRQPRQLAFTPKYASSATACTAFVDETVLRSYPMLHTRPRHNRQHQQRPDALHPQEFQTSSPHAADRAQ